MVSVRYFLFIATFALWLIQAELSPIQKRSLSRIWDEENNNRNLPGANHDEEWLGGGSSPGKRHVNARYWDEGNNNGGLLGAGGDETWLSGVSSPGKRWTTSLKNRYWDEGNNNGGLPGAGDDEEWLGGGTSPGKRWLPGIKARYWDEGSANGGLPGAGDDEEWLSGGGSPGKRHLNIDDTKRWTQDGVARYFPIQVHNGGDKQRGSDRGIEPAQDEVKDKLTGDTGVFKSLGDFFHRVHLVSNAPGK